MSAGAVPTTAFASFLGAQGARRPARRRPLVLVSVLGHAGILVLAALLGTRSPAAPATVPEPIHVRLSAPAGKPRAKPAPTPAPRQAHRPPRPKLSQPVVMLQPRPVEAPPDEAAETPPDAGDASADEPAALEEPVGVPGGRVGGVPGGVPDVPLELKDVARPPSLLSRVTPVYPPEARRQRLEGTVVLRVIVGMDGVVERPPVRIVRSVPGLDAAAVAAIEAWRFAPAIGHGGRPVRVVIEVPFQFYLR